MDSPPTADWWTKSYKGSLVDDGIVHSNGLDQHLKNLEKTLQAYLEAGLKLGPHKCSFFSPQITYLEHTVDKHDIKPVSSYVEAVQDWPLPLLEINSAWNRPDSLILRLAVSELRVRGQGQGPAARGKGRYRV